MDPIKELVVPDLSWLYFLSAFGFALLVRFLSALTRAYELIMGGLDEEDQSNKKGRKLSKEYKFWQVVKLSFMLGGKIDPKLNDYWLPFLIGLLELIILPTLMYSKLYEVIGVWIGLKTVGQWKKWEESRTIFNRFIFGNILVIFFSFLLYKFFILRMCEAVPVH